MDWEERGLGTPPASRQQHTHACQTRARHASCTCSHWPPSHTHSEVCTGVFIIGYDGASKLYPGFPFDAQMRHAQVICPNTQYWETHWLDANEPLCDMLAWDTHAYFKSALVLLRSLFLTHLSIHTQLLLMSRLWENLVYFSGVQTSEALSFCDMLSVATES